MKILIYRISSIGDIVLTTPVVRCLRNHYPDAQLHFITRNKYAETVSSNHYIDKLWLIKKSPLEILDQLKAEKFDVFIDLHRNWRSQRLMAHLNIRYYTFNKLNIRKWLYTRLGMNLMPDIHIVDRYFKAVRKLGVVNDEEGLDFFFPEGFMAQFKPQLPEKYITFAIGGTFFTKRYPTNHIISFVKDAPLPVVLLGGKSELQTGSEIYDSCPEKVVNGCNQFSLTESAAVIEKAKLVISNDTGMMHIAAALHKPLITLWGNTVPAFGMYPYYPAGFDSKLVMLEVKDLRCRPCSKLGYKHCPKSHFKCMNNISPQQLLDAANNMIQ